VTFGVVRQLAPDVLSGAAELLAEAFYSNPAHTYICPDEGARSRQLQWLLGANLRAQPDLTSSFCIVRDSTVVAMGFWTRPHSESVGLMRQILAGLLRAPFVLGLGGFGRLLEVSAAIDLHRDRAMGQRPYGYLNNMAVREDLRGNGIGSQLLRDQAVALRARSPEMPLVLSTQRSENVTFYGRLGFETVSEERIGKGDGAFRSWTMVCEASTR
jgi:GNAT superfamily N-acetyltransferase